MQRVYIHTRIPKELKTMVARTAHLLGVHENEVFTNALTRGLTMAKKKASKKVTTKVTPKKKGY